MIRYLIQRILIIIALFFLLTYIIWLFTTREGIITIHTINLTNLLPASYISWLSLVLQGNLGYSFTAQAPVTTAFVQRLPVTLLIVIPAFLLQEFLAVIIGVTAATHKNTRIEYFLTQSIYLLSSLPVFWLAFMVINLFYVQWNLLHSLGLVDLHVSGTDYGTPAYWQFFHAHTLEALQDILKHVFLPILLIAFTGLATDAQLVRSSLIEVLNQEYIRAARAHGIPNRLVVWRHGLRNAILPLITSIGTQLPRIIFVVAVIEFVFNLPGVGSFFINAAFSPPASESASGTALKLIDYDVITAYFLILGSVALLSSFFTDIFYAIADPRIRINNSSDTTTVHGQLHSRLEINAQPMFTIKQFAIYPSSLFTTALFALVVLFGGFSIQQSIQTTQIHDINGTWYGQMHIVGYPSTNNENATMWVFLDLHQEQTSLNGTMQYCVPVYADTLTEATSIQGSIVQYQTFHLFASTKNGEFYFNGDIPATSARILQSNITLMIYHEYPTQMDTITMHPGSVTDFSSQCKKLPKQ